VSTQETRDGADAGTQPDDLERPDENEPDKNEPDGDKAQQDKADQDKAGQDKAGQDKAGQDKAGQDKAGQDKAGGKTEPDNREQPGDQEPERSGTAQRRSLAVRAAALPREAAVRAGRLPLRSRITSMAVLGALAAASVVSAVLLAIAAHHDDATSAASTAARKAATAEIQQILSYDYRTINSDVARANADTTGQFHQQFGTLSGQLIVPAALQQQTVTQAKVANSSVVSANANQVVVLLFVDQATTNKTQRQAQPVGSQVKVTMQQASGRWLVAQFQAL
jgi:Mce-associated membrane protein